MNTFTNILNFSRKTTGFLLLLLGQWACGQQMLSLRPYPIQPKPYCFVATTDERIGKTLGQIFINGKPQQVVLGHNTTKTLKNWFEASTKPHESLRFITVRIKQLQFIEQEEANGKVKGKCVADISFEAYRNDTLSLPVCAYKSSSQYLRSASNTSLHDDILQKMLQNSMGYFDKWFSLNASQTPALAKGTKVLIGDYPAEKSDNDSVFYPQKITWADFRGPVGKLNRYGAAVFSSYAYEATVKMESDTLVFRIILKTYVVKESSWVLATMIGNLYALNHEQRHFDITKIICNRFKKRILQSYLDIDDYDSQLQYLWLETYRGLHKLQEQYDTETAHGKDTEAQTRWNEWIEQELRK